MGDVVIEANCLVFKDERAMVVLRAEARFDEGASCIFIMMIHDGGEN